ncbi:MAG: PadR family transcriptional regulator [Eubacteriales bacterium]
MSLSYAILGLINYSPMTGYDLKKLFDDSINFFWSAQTSQIYRELKTWEKKGCIVSTVQPSEKGPDKRIYGITEQGIDCLKNWLSDMPDEVDEDNRNAFLLRVFLLSQLGVDELVFQIQKRLKKYRRDLLNLKAVESKMQAYAQTFGREDEVHFWKIILSRGYHDVESHIHWAEESLEYLEKLRKDKSQLR